MRIITANLNGIRSAHKKGFFDWMATTNADVVCVQEIKAQESDLTDEMRAPTGYTGYFSYAVEKGYSGVGIYTRQAPLQLRHTMDHPIFDSEGRYVEADFGTFTVVSLYLPSASSRNPEEQAIKQQKKDEALSVFANQMRALKASGRSVIICGYRKRHQKWLAWC